MTGEKKFIAGASENGLGNYANKSKRFLMERKDKYFYHIIYTRIYYTICNIYKITMLNHRIIVIR